jgi:hypothetical protein
MQELINQINQLNNEQELFENLLNSVLEGDKHGAVVIATTIQAGRDLRFDLQKVLKENDNRERHINSLNKKKAEK